MSELHELEAQGIRRDGTARVFDLRSRREVHLFFSPSCVPEASGDDARNYESKEAVATSFEQQIEQIRSLAERHYPDDTTARGEWLVDKLIERLRTYHAMFQALEVRQMDEPRKAGE